jgi:cytosine deaminase
MRDALKNGATVVGGLDPATIDLDLEKSLRTTFDLAYEFDAKVDIHLHDGGSLGSHTIRRICHYTKECGLTGGVHISHAYSLGDVPREEVRELAKLLASVDIGINTTSPIDAPAPPIPILKEEGVRVSIINDNINDHWSPFGSGDLLQRASRAAEKFGAIDEVSLAGYLGHVTGGITPLDAQGNQVWPKAGDRADFVLVDATCSAEAVARVPSGRVVMKNGVVTSGKL